MTKNKTSFGNDWSSMFGSMVGDEHALTLRQYNDNNREVAIRFSSEMGANMGGTELLEAINAIVTLPPAHGTKRFVFVLTDGGVSNTSHILHICEQHREQNKFFTIAIGSGASLDLTRGKLYYTI